MNPKARLVLVVVLFGAFVSVGSRAAYGAPPRDACSLLTVAQVGAALGVPVSPNTPDPKKLCLWSGAGGKSATLTIWDLAAFPSAKPAAVAGIVVTPVKGIGDDAVFAGYQNSGESSGYPGKLFVKKNSVVFSITVLGFSVDQAREKEKALALNVVSEL